MKKLINGIVEFRRNVRPGYRERFARLALGQSPDTLFIACSDSRVAPNVFASTDPGDLFVIRNVGNLIPPAESDGRSMGDESEAAAIEFAVNVLTVENIIVCGHSECGAMINSLKGQELLTQVAQKSPNLVSWLRFVAPAIQQLKMNSGPLQFDSQLSPHNRLSQLNVLSQMKHVRTYPTVNERIAAGNLSIHGWWFDIEQAEVQAYDEASKRFLVIDDERATKILSQLKTSHKHGS